MDRMPPPALAGVEWAALQQTDEKERGYLALFPFKYFKKQHHLHKVKIQSCKVMPLPETRVLFRGPHLRYQFLV